MQREASVDDEITRLLFHHPDDPMGVYERFSHYHDLHTFHVAAITYWNNLPRAEQQRHLQAHTTWFQTFPRCPLCDRIAWGAALGGKPNFCTAHNRAIFDARLWPAVLPLVQRGDLDALRSLLDQHDILNLPHAE